MDLRRLKYVESYPYIQLDDKHTVTFTLMEVDHNPEYLNEDIKTMIGVYRDLQTLLRLY